MLSNKKKIKINTILRSIKTIHVIIGFLLSIIIVFSIKLKKIIKCTVNAICKRKTMFEIKLSNVKN